ncbi:MAG: recombinase family protein [Candidatus Kuenenia stuttgartiensis]|nr:recombinase family protein [Candidatus Kuenenia stuttgartiensis]
MKRAYGYTRSTIRETSSIQLQQLRIKDYCQENKIKLIEIFDDNGKSASRTFQNEGFDELLSRCKKTDKIDAVIVTDYDRIARNSDDFSVVKKFLQKKGINLIAVNQPNSIEETPMEMFMEEIKEVICAYEKLFINTKRKQL